MYERTSHHDFLLQLFPTRIMHVTSPYDALNCLSIAWMAYVQSTIFVNGQMSMSRTSQIGARVKDRESPIDEALSFRITAREAEWVTNASNAFFIPEPTVVDVKLCVTVNSAAAFRYDILCKGKYMGHQIAEC
jgi:hypothetical protein